jgi:hypothetical protein
LAVGTPDSFKSSAIIRNEVTMGRLALDTAHDPCGIGADGRAGVRACARKSSSHGAAALATTTTTAH